MQSKKFLIGIMSGTSMDAVDAVLAYFPDTFPAAPCQVAGFVSLPFAQEVRAALFALQSSGPDELARAAQSARALAQMYAQAAQQLCAQAGIAPAQVAAIGAHGQTVRHQPQAGYTCQLLNGALLAELSGIDVVCDFRSRDVAAGGQGAPLVPAFHAALFGAAQGARVVLNLGGIANISILRAEQVLGFDTGPANVLLDLWCSRHTGQPFDANGAWAASASPHPELLAQMLSEPFFQLAPPKSTGRDLFDQAWLARHLQAWPQLPPARVQATLAQLSAESVAQAVRKYAPDAQEVLLCGGGAENADLCARLAAALPAVALRSTAQAGIAPQQVEALAFAWLAGRHLQRASGNLPQVTGARGLRVLGCHYPA
ncbi:anhydro-N-acetylmuramic acid kinase [Massilia sp. W12]|uniref:anhydro-N-acetylmuramic acid kinase n=1 Tax=Massilia sp. W12 TaxID=3126507 RepID=UPI0030CE41CC